MSTTYRVKPHGEPVFDFETDNESELTDWLLAHTQKEYTVLFLENGALTKTVNGDFFTSPETYDDYRILKKR